MNFKELRVANPILRAIEDLEFIYPTAVQEKCFRQITAGNDVVAIAKTGTGKTFAYLLPILSQLEYSEQKNPRVIILVPTRELAMQTFEEIQKLAKYKTVKIKYVFGGKNINTQKDYIFDGGTDILIATPGRLYDIAITGILRLNNVKKIVIDEVDEMLNFGFRNQIERILEFLPQKRQNLMFSATLSQDVENFVNKYFNNPVVIKIDDNATPVELIKQKAFFVPNFNTKIELLKYLLKNNPDEFIKNLVFVSNKKQADYLFDKLNHDFENKIGVIHSNKSQNLRFNTIKNFEKGIYKTLIATDIVAKGLDFTEVSHVINFSVPEISNDYIHRIGRTGRAEKKGNALLFISENEYERYNEILKIVNNNILREVLPHDLEISNILMEDEKPANNQKIYLKTPSLKNSGKAFHEKSEKRLKTNSGKKIRH